MGVAQGGEVAQGVGVAQGASEPEIGELRYLNVSYHIYKMQNFGVTRCKC